MKTIAKQNQQRGQDRPTPVTRQETIEKKTSPRLVKPGDVLAAEPTWAFGRGSSSPDHPTEVSATWHERYVVQDARHRRIPAYDRFDPTRPAARFVVETAGYAGGGTGMGPHDVYPDGWQVTARRLAADGGYDPAGELIVFFQSGCFDCLVEQPRVVGHLQRTVHFAPMERARD